MYAQNNLGFKANAQDIEVQVVLGADLKPWLCFFT